MLTASSGGGAQPHEMMDAILVKIAGDDGPNRRATLERSVGQEKGGSTMSEELEKERAHVRAAQWAFAHASMVVDCDEWEGDEAADDDWEDDWEDEAPATRDPSTPDWRDQFDKIVDEDVERARKKRERVCEALGDVTYNSPTGLVVAQQCADGGIWFDGTRYNGVSDWLRRCFSKRI